MNACDEKLKDSILRVMDEEEIKLKEEMEAEKPHVFSEEFEKKMKELIRG